jgi:replicative DNA helicase
MIQIEQAILSSLLWAFHSRIDGKELKVTDFNFDENLFSDPFHKQVLQTIKELDSKHFIIDAITVSEALIKRNAMNGSKWLEINAQTAGGYQFVKTYLVMLQAQKKKAVYEI